MWSRYEVSFKQTNKHSLFINVDNPCLLHQDTLNRVLKDIQDQNETLQYHRDEGKPAQLTWC